MRTCRKDELYISHNNPLPHCPHGHHHSHPQERGGAWVEGVGVEEGQGGNQEDQIGLSQNQEGLAGGDHQGSGVPSSPLFLEDHNHLHLLVAGFWRAGHESFCLGNRNPAITKTSTKLLIKAHYMCTCSILLKRVKLLALEIWIVQSLNGIHGLFWVIHVYKCKVFYNGTLSHCSILFEQSP